MKNVPNIGPSAHRKLQRKYDTYTPPHSDMAVDKANFYMQLNSIVFEGSYLVAGGQDYKQR